ncbi:unnamed protein product, partial [Mesorhabditis spiculigera]
MLARRELLVRFAVLFIGYGFTTFCRRVVFIFLQALHDDLGVDKGRLDEFEWRLAALIQPTKVPTSS